MSNNHELPKSTTGILSRQNWLFQGLWFAQFPSFVLFALVSFRVALQMDRTVPLPVILVSLCVFGVICCAFIGFAVFWRHYMFSRQAVERYLSVKGQGASYFLLGMRPPAGEDSEEHLLNHFAINLFKLYALGLGSIHTAAIFGVATALVTGKAGLCLPFLLLATVFSILYRPKPAQIVADGLECYRKCQE